MNVYLSPRGKTDINTFVLCTVCLDKPAMWSNYTQILPLDPHLPLHCHGLTMHVPLADWLLPLSNVHGNLIRISLSDLHYLLACVNAKRHFGTFKVLSVTKEAVVNTHRQVWGIRVPCGIKLPGPHKWPCHFPLIKSSGCFTSQQYWVASALGFGACK